MDKHPVKAGEHEVDKAEQHHEPKKPEQQDIEVIKPFSLSPFFSFRYSYKEISSFGGKTYVKSKEERFEDGRYQSEEFEGTTDQGTYYNNMVREMQHYFLNQMSSFVKQLSFFLPFSTKDSVKDKAK